MRLKSNMFVSAAVTAFLTAPKVSKQAMELDRIRAQARAVGLEKEFDAAWSYEVRRFAQLPGDPATPKQVFQIIMEIF